MSDDNGVFGLGRYGVEGNLARGPEPDPWSVLAAPERAADDRPPRPGWRWMALVTVLVVALGALAGALAGRVVRPETQSASLPTSAPIAAAPLGGLADMVEQITPSVVYLSTRVSGPGLGEETSPFPNGTLTGLIVDERGYIITSRSGVDKVGELQVVLYDGRHFRGKIIRKSPDNDVAVVKIDDAVGLQAARLGRSADLRVGEPLVVIGDSLSYGGEVNVSEGVVTALRRKILVDNLDGLVQTDARIGPVNTGGPVLDFSGSVVGLAVTAASDPAGSYAIGIDSIRPFVDQVVQRRTPMSSGVKVTTLTPEVAFGVGISYTRGVIVTEVRQGGPGELAGLRPGDVVTAIMGEPVDSEERFVRLTVAGPPDGLLILSVLRDAQTLEVPMTLAHVVA